MKNLNAGIKRFVRIAFVAAATLPFLMIVASRLGLRSCELIGRPESA
jgi:hypothetical protein